MIAPAALGADPSGDEPEFSVRMDGMASDDLASTLDAADVDERWRCIDPVDDASTWVDIESDAIVGLK